MAPVPAPLVSRPVAPIAGHTGVPTPASIAGELKTVDVKTSTFSTASMFNAVEYNRLLPANFAAKREAYNDFRKSNREVAAAETELAKAKTASQRAVAERKLAIAEQSRADRLTHLKDVMRRNISIHPQYKAAADKANVRRELEAAIDNFDPQIAVERKKFVVNIDGEEVSITNGIETYATDRWDAMAGRLKGQNGTNVQQILEKAGLSEQRQKIFNGIVKNEAQTGGFSEFQTWDRGKVTWGFAQFTLGPDGSYNISQVLKTLKRDNPEVFRERFQKYGIDVSSANNAVIQVTRPDGTVLKGTQAADFLRTDPKLAGVFIVAGKDLAVQSAQVSRANQIIDQTRNRSIAIKAQQADGSTKTVTIRVKDVVNSEYGVGILSDRAVHAGSGGATAIAKKALKNYAVGKTLDAAELATWGPAAEKAIIKALEESAGKRRTKNIKASGLSTAPSTF
jgi:hypothetical protein